jgi:hypothetical protein
MEAVGDGHPGGAFYRMAGGGEWTGGEGNGDRWWWSLNPFVSHSRRETTGGERMGWRRRLTFTGRWHERATGSVCCAGAVSRGRRRQLAHQEVGDEGRSGPGGPWVGYKGRMGWLMLQGRWRKKKRKKMESGR